MQCYMALADQRTWPFNCGSQAFCLGLCDLHCPKSATILTGHRWRCNSRCSWVLTIWPWRSWLKWHWKQMGWVSGVNSGLNHCAPDWWPSSLRMGYLHSIYTGVTMRFSPTYTELPWSQLDVNHHMDHWSNILLWDRGVNFLIVWSYCGILNRKILIQSEL